ncbi:MAG: isoprenylcysteine carboxylmethyltransferase family protein [Acidobacteria bacterium]|nr:isoprenylcysteine carboxylmethyltransferase family protein [Acidobacteriota bacterium]
MNSELTMMEDPQLGSSSMRSSSTSRRVGPWAVKEMLAGRVLPGAFFAVVLAVKTRQLAGLAAGAGGLKNGLSEPAFLASLTYQALVIVFLGTVVWLFVVRREPIRKTEGMRVRLCSLSGAFILTVVAVLPRNPQPWGLDATASLLLLNGTAITLWALFYLGRCFSILPEVRGTVIGGPYHYVRHPMYLGEFISGMGLVLANLSWFSVVIYAVFTWLQLQRMNNEERVLGSSFETYRDYRLRTSRLIPLVY